MDTQSKGFASFLGNPDNAKKVAREGYIQQAGLTGSDADSVRQGAWDGRIEGLDLTAHVLQNAETLVQKIGGSGGQMQT